MYGSERSDGGTSENQHLLSAAGYPPTPADPYAQGRASSRSTRVTKLPQNERIQGSSPGSVVARASAAAVLRPYTVTNRIINQVPGVTLTFRDVTILHRTMFELHRKPEVVVQQAIGVFHAGTISAICATRPLASRKLLGALAGSVTPAEGVILANNIPVQSTAFRTMIGYVSKERRAAIDAFTTRTNVRFALQMRSRISRRDVVDAAVSDALALVGLDEEQFIAQLDELGILKLHLAMELVTDPPALFVEEPLAELNSHHHIEVCELLQRIAQELHKTVVVCTSTMPHLLYERLHSTVLIGAGGHTVYSGRREHLTAYFAWLRLPVHSLDSPDAGSSSGIYGSRSRFSTFPTFSRATAASAASRSAIRAQHGGHRSHQFETAPSTAHVAREGDAAEMGDDAEDILIVDAGDAAVDLLLLWEDRDARQRGNAAGRNPYTMQFAARFFDSEFRARLRDEQDEFLVAGTPHALVATPCSAMGDLGDPAASSPNPRAYPTLHDAPSPSTLAVPVALSRRHEHPSLGRKTALLLRYKVEQALRQKDFYLAFIVLFLVLAFSTWVASEQVLDQRGMQNIRGIIFFLFSVILELNIMLLPAFFDDAVAFPHQRDGGYYNALSAVLVFITRVIIARVVFLATTAVFIEFVLTGMNELLILLGVTSFAHACLLYLVALLAGSLRAATFVAYCIEAYMIIFSGFLINMASLPGVVAKSSLMRYGYGAAVAHLLRGQPFSCDASYVNYNGTRPSWLSNATSYCYTGDSYLALEGFTDDSTETNCGQLLILSSVMLVLAAFRLHFMGR